MMDVTAEYLPVSDVEIEVTDTIPAEESVYLAVYSDDWTATAYTDTYQNRIATFRDVKNEMLYMPVVYRKGNIYPIDRPFIVDRVGEKRFLTADDSTERCVVSYLLPLMTEMSTAVANKDRLPKDIFDCLYSGEARKRPVNGAAYSLFIGMLTNGNISALKLQLIIILFSRKFLKMPCCIWQTKTRSS